MPTQQRQRYRIRAIEEREAASKAFDSNVAGLHEQIAEMYDAMGREMDKEFPPEAKRPSAA